jgi:uncharacterized protein YndB with AHSA1/START domain
MTPTTQPEGTLETGDGRDVVRFERHLEHPIEKVWRALTEPDELIAWLGEAELDLVEGGQIVLRWQNTDGQGNRAILHGTITELDPPHVIEYDSDIHGVLRWELRKAGDGCVLTFSSRLSLPEDYRTKVLAGWHLHLDFLEEALSGGAVDWSRWDDEHLPRWEVHHDRYTAALG